jgi:hypothetical protein
MEDISFGSMGDERRAALTPPGDGSTDDFVGAVSFSSRHAR